MDNCIIIDLSLLTPTLILSEALLSAKQSQVVMSILDHTAKNPQTLGKPIIELLREDKKAFGKLIGVLKETPLGNPAWGLFSNGASESLMSDLETFIAKQGKPRSLQNAMKQFINEYPAYGSAEDASKIGGMTRAELGRSWSEKWVNFPTGREEVSRTSWTKDRILHVSRLAEVASLLMLLQYACIPASKRQLVTKAIMLDPEAKPSDFEAIKSPVYRPDAPYYALALRQLLLSSLKVSRDIWDEMVEMHQRPTLTNFLPFAPLLLQTFSYSDMNLPLPSINTLASMMGAFAGLNGTFMGGIKNKPVWEKQGLTLGKLCQVVDDPLEELSSADESKYELEVLSLTGTSRLRIKEKMDDVSAEPTFGEDKGWVLIKEDLLGKDGVKLTEIKESPRSDNIIFNNFPKKDESIVFKSGTDLMRLDSWRKRRLRRPMVLLLFGEKGEWHNTLPTLRGTVNPYNILPVLTGILRNERRSGKAENSLAAQKDGRPTYRQESIAGQSFGEHQVINENDSGLSRQRPLQVAESTFIKSDGEFFIAESPKEDKCKKLRVLELRREKRKELRENEELERQEAGLSERDALIARVEHWSLERLHMTYLTRREQARIVGKHDDALARLMKHDLGIEFNFLYGLRPDREVIEQQKVEKEKKAKDKQYVIRKPYHFKTRLGDEELTAVNSWLNAIDVEMTDLSSDAVVPKTKAAHRIWVAMSLLASLVDSNNSSSDIFPITPYLETLVMSLLGHLYWIYFLKREDHFRVRMPDENAGFLPTVRVNRCQHDFGAIDAEEVVKEREPWEIEGIKVSRLSLINAEAWSLEGIFKNFCDFFGLGRDCLKKKHPLETLAFRRYLDLGVKVLAARLSNVNLAGYLSFVSGSPSSEHDAYRELFKEKKRELDEWYKGILTEFNSSWVKIGEDWMSFREEEVV